MGGGVDVGACGAGAAWAPTQAVAWEEGWSRLGEGKEKKKERKRAREKEDGLKNETEIQIEIQILI